MNRFRKIAVLMLFVAPVFQACEVVDPLASEQYQKDIYIVGANERIATFNVPFGTQESTFVSISASGTKRVEQDVEITLRQADSLINWYNGKYMLDATVKYRPLSSALVTIPSWKATLPAGEIYTRFPFSINTSSLHCDSLYAIGMAIDAVSGYQKAEKGTELVFVLKLVNEWSGNYSLEATSTRLKSDDGGVTWVADGAPATQNYSRILTATSADAVRFLHGTTKETLAEYTSWDPAGDYFAALERYGIQFVRTGATGNNFTVAAWESGSGGMPIIEGTAEYVTVGFDSGFRFSYDYEDGGNRFRMQGMFRELK
ncbi:hypothetical protein SAMD00024442_15_4 [Candidatus Symbiothrix dinenymphae]|nr:hypothetical protein SAMD00024442_15_4 [Candidatus Symbiothrix dinenymphae]